MESTVNSVLIRRFAVIEFYLIKMLKLQQYVADLAQESPVAQMGHKELLLLSKNLGRIFAEIKGSIPAFDPIVDKGIYESYIQCLKEIEEDDDENWLAC